MKRWVTILPLAAPLLVSALLVTACGSGDDGQQLHQRRTGAAGIDPCQVLDPGALGTYGSFAGGAAGTVDGARACTWSTRGNAPDRMSVVVSVREQRPLLEVKGLGVHLDLLNGRNEAVRGTDPTTCTASLAVGKPSRVDVLVRQQAHQGVAGSNDSVCAKADAIAKLVEPALPDA